MRVDQRAFELKKPATLSDLLKTLATKLELAPEVS